MPCLSYVVGSHKIYVKTNCAVSCLERERAVNEVSLITFFCFFLLNWRTKLVWPSVNRVKINEYMKKFK